MFLIPVWVLALNGNFSDWFVTCTLLGVFIPHSMSMQNESTPLWIEVLPLSHYTDNPKYLQSLYTYICILSELWQHDVYSFVKFNSLSHTRELLTLEVAPLQLLLRVSSPLFPVSHKWKIQLATSPLVPGQRVSHFRHKHTSTPHLPYTISLIAAVNKSRL